MQETGKKIIYTILSLYILFGLSLLYWVVIYSGSGDGDTLEHVHSSWLVYHGNIPYKDFFQHHNPLLWYVGAPFVGMYEYTLRAVDAVNLLTVTVTGVTVFYVYRLHKNFLTNALGGLIASAFCLLPQDSLYNKDFKPDNYMTACLVIGIYYLLSHVKTKKLLDICISFLFFFAAFMFTQKAILILFFIGVITIYLIYNHQIKFKDSIQGAILPILIYLVFLTFLYSKDILTFYFRANFELNAHISAVFDVRRFITPSPEMLVPIFLSFYALLGVSRENMAVKIVSMIFIAEFWIRMYYFNPFIYYFAFLHVIASVMAGIAAVKLTKKYKYAVWLFLIYFLCLGGFYAEKYSKRITVGDSYKYGAAGFVLENTNPCDYVVNGYRIGYNLFNKDVDFIWNLKGQIDVIAATIGLRPLSDLESLIRKYRPKIIYGGNYYDTYREYRGEIGKYPIHWVSKHLLEERYTPLHRDDLYILKPEYQSYDCRYNQQTKSYEYQDKH